MTQTNPGSSANRIEHEFPSGGEMGALIRSLDWSKSGLGPISAWPTPLKAAVRLMLPAKAQIVIFWGPELVALYNDAYAPTIGDKHPRALGRPARESWTELWDDLEPLLRRVLETGETVFANIDRSTSNGTATPRACTSTFLTLLFGTRRARWGRPLHRERDDRASCCTRTSTLASSGDEPPPEELVRHGRCFDRSERSVSPNATGIRAVSSWSACCASAGQRTGAPRDIGH
jgi:hypothetical protein